MDDIGPKITIFRLDQREQVEKGLNVTLTSRNPQPWYEFACYLCGSSMFLVEYSSAQNMFGAELTIDQLKERRTHEGCECGEPVFYGDIVLSNHNPRMTFERTSFSGPAVLVGRLKRIFHHPQRDAVAKHILHANPQVHLGGFALGYLKSLIFREDDRDMGLC